MRALLSSLLILCAAPACAEVVAKVPSPDGKLTAVVNSAEGDWQTIDVVETASGRKLADHLLWGAFANPAWAPDSSGFYYSRRDKPYDDPEIQKFNLAHFVEYHRIGTPQDDDLAVYGTDRAAMFHAAQVTKDGRWLVITSSENRGDKQEVILSRLGLAHPAPFKLIRVIDSAWGFAGNRGDVFYFVTTRDAPKGRLVSIDLNNPVFTLTEVVPQSADTLVRADLTDKALVLTYAGGQKTVPLKESK